MKCKKIKLSEIEKGKETTQKQIKLRKENTGRQIIKKKAMGNITLFYERRRMKKKWKKGIILDVRTDSRSKRRCKLYLK